MSLLIKNLFKITNIIGISILFFSSVNAQNSYSFSVAQPTIETAVPAVESNYFGTYKNDSLDTYYEFDKNGVHAITTIYSAISRETIRESSKYSVKDGFLFGIVENDSIPCVLEGEKYYFAIRHKEQIIGPKSKHILKKVSNSLYIICFYEHETCTPSKFEFKGKKLQVSHFDYQSDTKIFEPIKIQNKEQKENMNWIILTPSEKEWGKLFKSDEIFGKEKVFLKID